MNLNRKVLCIGHRGYSAFYPENSFRAIQAAVELKADGFECDLRMTKDSVIVLFHDDDLKRLCGVNTSIENSTWPELQKLRILYREPICRIEEILEAFPDTVANFEIKASSKALLVVDALRDLFAKYSTSKPRMISSFSYEVLKHAHALQLDQSIRLSPIFKSPKDPLCQKIGKAEWTYSWNMFHQNLENIEDRAPKPLWLWTMNEETDWKKCLCSPLGEQIEAIISDRPNELVKFLSR